MTVGMYGFLDICASGAMMYASCFRILVALWFHKFGSIAYSLKGLTPVTTTISSFDDRKSII